MLAKMDIQYSLEVLNNFHTEKSSSICSVCKKITTKSVL